MSVKQFEPKPLSVSQRALAYIATQVEQHNASAVVLGVKETGCNGYMYELSYLDKSAATTDMRRLSFEHGIVVYIDNKSWDIVKGTQIELVTEGLNTILKFANPNADGYCGCGESFSISGT